MPEFQELVNAREEYSRLILSSTSPKRIIIAGPGTGKTFTFRGALQIAGGGLVLSFLNNLVADLTNKLGALAEVSTFHGFCRHLLHRFVTEGLTSHFNYYPQLPVLIAQDISSLLGTYLDSDEIDKAFQTIDDSEGIISRALWLGNYYDSVSHNDAVYRVLVHLGNNPSDIPTYPLVIVDEYQDFNLLEVRFLDILSLRNPILVAGDDDQALYPFKYASPEYLRGIAGRGDFTVYWLPYCSRCTSVVVAAANRVVERARAIGLLTNRVNKPFECYLPDKATDSQTYPSIIHARCSVQRNNAQYMCEYVNYMVSQIPDTEIAESRNEGYPTVLVAGPSQFVKPIHAFLACNFADVEFREGSKSQVDILDGYEYLASNPNSRLGWRIVLHCDTPPDVAEIIRTCVTDGRELFEVLADEYKQKHIAAASTLNSMRNGDAVSEREIHDLADASGRRISEVEEWAPQASGQLVLIDETPVAQEPTGPRIVITTLVGAKGLDASHVFLVGISERHFPRDNNHLTDAEVCSFLVGLTRARKCCYIVTCDRFGNDRLTPGIFIDWIQPFIDSQYVDASYIRRIRAVSD